MDIDQYKSLSMSLMKSLEVLSFDPPVKSVYNVLRYALIPHLNFISKQGLQEGKDFFLGMNPGPFGMAQTGVPFGSIPKVRDWMGLSDAGLVFEKLHPKRPIEGFLTKRSEVSGERLWSMFQAKYDSAEKCFQENFIANYCPLMFLNERGANITPEALPKKTRAQLEEICDGFLSSLIDNLKPKRLFGIGNYAWQALSRLQYKTPILLTHPSPLNPKSNKAWPKEILQILEEKL